jgi:amino acid efflux transporter
MSDKKLGLFSGTSYAIGSIIGSGILFLPSLTYKLSGSNVFLSWLLATLLCVPLLIMFYDMSKLVTNNDGVKGFIELGLGKKLASCFPILMLSTVSIGMPSSALIVGKFVQDYLGFANIEYIVALYLLAFGLISNLLGKSFGEKIQNFVSVAFFVVGLILFIMTVPAAKTGYHKIVPDFNLKETFSGITMAFWAFAGFENLTFITSDFKNPKRDFLLSMIIALVVCGVLYLGITANYAAIIPLAEVKTVMGLFQLSQVIEPKAISGLVIVALAFFALKTNFNSWIRGLSSMIKSSSESGAMPKSLGLNNRPLYILGGLFLFSLTLSFFFPQFLETGLVIVSSNFVVIYVLCTVSFLKTTKSPMKKVMGVVTLLVLLVSLITSKEKLLYPVLVIGLTYLVFAMKNKKTLRASLVMPIALFFISSTSFAKVKEINVALVFRFENKFNGTTQFLEKGFDFAKKELEKSGKIKINYKKYSHDENLTSVIEATKMAIKDGHFIIIGGENSDEALAIADVIKDKNVVLITPTATNPRVTLDKPYVFRTCISDDKVADKMAKFTISNLKSQKIGILHNVSYPYSDYLSKRFLSKSEELIETMSNNQALRPSVVERKIVRDQKDFANEIKFFKSQGITHLVLLSFQSDLLRFYAQASIERFSPQFIGSDGWGLNEAVFKNVHQVKDGTKFLGYRNVYWNEESKTKSNLSFKKLFKEMFHEEANSWAAISYDTMSVLSESFLSISGETNGESLKNSLKKYNGKKLITTDHFSFDENNTPSQDVVIYKIDDKGIGFYGNI